MCGFLGAGKTTLLKHILETQHIDPAFKCAVIVNDVAELNIDKNLIDRTSLLQSDDVIAMQNGCVCCTLQSDLVEQIVQLAEKGTFTYMIIEASGVSEPAEIGPLFDECDDDHDHDEHKSTTLHDVARLDTCVTVVDCADFFANLDNIRDSADETYPQLLIEQIEYSNVILLNKTDLVSAQQLQTIHDQVAILNSKANVIETRQSQVDLKYVLNTRSWNSVEMTSPVYRAMDEEPSKVLTSSDLKKCCTSSLNAGKAPCCSSKKNKLIGNAFDSGLSTVYIRGGDSAKDRKLPVSTDSRSARHVTRFGINSFIYRARRPFHPGRLQTMFLDPYFVLEHELEDMTTDDIRSVQSAAAARKKARIKAMGCLLRTKGFIWVASVHDLMIGLNQAGNMVTLEPETLWLELTPELWKGLPIEQMISKNMQVP